MTDRPYTDADVELVATTTERHYLDSKSTDAMGNNQCICEQWAEGFDGPSWDEHMAEVALAALAAAGLLPAEHHLPLLALTDDEVAALRFLARDLRASSGWIAPTLRSALDKLAATVAEPGDH